MWILRVRQLKQIHQRHASVRRGIFDNHPLEADARYGPQPVIESLDVSSWNLYVTKGSAVVLDGFVEGTRAGAPFPPKEVHVRRSRPREYTRVRTSNYRAEVSIVVVAK